AGAADATAALAAGAAATTALEVGTSAPLAAATAAEAAEAALCASVARSRRTDIRKLDTRRVSRGLRATLPATISDRSGFVSHVLLLLRLRSSSDTRWFDWPTPEGGR